MLTAFLSSYKEHGPLEITAGWNSKQRLPGKEGLKWALNSGQGWRIRKDIRRAGKRRTAGDQAEGTAPHLPRSGAHCSPSPEKYPSNGHPLLEQCWALWMANAWLMQSGEPGSVCRHGSELCCRTSRVGFYPITCPQQTPISASTSLFLPLFS